MSSATRTGGGDALRCVVCDTPLAAKICAWSLVCPACDTWRSTLEPAIESEDLHQAIDTEARVAGFKELRLGNNNHILDEIGKLRGLEGSRLLDVGSAHGWFIEEALRRGSHAEGIEPDETVRQDALAHGLQVRHGYFPSTLAPGEQFDVIAFNDVFEHIPDVDATLNACAASLAPGGILSINIPSATGLGFRIARTLARLGLRGPYERLWQHNLPSPHLHYFTPASLQRFVEQHGLRVRRVVPLASIRRDGLWARVHTVSRPSPVSVLNFVALWLGATVLNRPKHSDIFLLLAARVDGAKLTTR
jgi:2-polyprenyl-3-methyl-5-hydroxy-6-metoxy-1,4-benzoquinol methylase